MLLHIVCPYKVYRNIEKSETKQNLDLKLVISHDYLTFSICQYYKCCPNLYTKKRVPHKRNSYTFEIKNNLVFNKPTSCYSIRLKCFDSINTICKIRNIE